jgi:signal transduction histidine kinase
MAEDQQASRQRFAHELLSPLTVILGSAEMLQKQSEGWPGYTRELLDLILTQGHRLQETLNALATSAEVEGNIVRVIWTNAQAGPEAASRDSAEAVGTVLSADDRPGG